MHPRQASLLNQASELLDKTAAKKRSEAPPAPAAPLPANPVLWKYDDPDGKGIFFLTTRRMNVRSPFTGKAFTARPVKHTPMQVGKELKDQAQEQRAPKTAAVDPWKA